ncbi:MAG: hypothetical protein ABIL68_08285 [bacterium]
MKTLRKFFEITDDAITAVNFDRWIGVYAGMKIIHVEGATGLHDTNYEEKATVDALKEVDLVYLHVEAPDEAGHEGNVELKIKTIEDLDSRVVKTIMKETAKMDEPVAIALLPDHPTPCEVRTHVRDPVPFIIYKPGEEPDDVKEYDEISVEKRYYGTLEGNEFIRAFLN